MSRPLKTDEPLARTFSFKVSEKVGRLWDAKIASSGYSKSEFFRQAVLDNKTVVEPPKRPIQQRPKRTIEEQRILFLLAKQSNNINQIAHALNSARRAGQVGEHLFVDILDRLDEISKTAQNWRPE